MLDTTRGTQRVKPNSLDEACEHWCVHDTWDNEVSIVLMRDGWYAVSNEEDSIIAYFWNKADAYRFRLAMINRDLNP